MTGFEVFDHEEKEAVIKVFEEGSILFAHGFDNLRKRYHVREFEKDLKNHFKSNYSTVVSSGTAALKCALKAVGVKAGDEVITQPFNFVGTIEAIIDCGAIPRICRINKDLHIDCESISQLINHKTKAIIPVNMLGMLGNIDDLVKLRKTCNIPFIEDNCESVGAKYKDKFAGNFYDVGVLSFDHGKMIACGEGGAIITDSDEINTFVRRYSDHGHKLENGVPRGDDKGVMPGFNYRMTELQAAVGKVQLKKLNKIIDKNKIRYEIINKSLSKKYYIRKPQEYSTGSYDTFMFATNENSQRKDIINILNKNGIGTKNVPDALRWHCSYYWQHLITDLDSNNSKDCLEKLLNYIAIPVSLRISEEIYDKVSNEISEYL